MLEAPVPFLVWILVFGSLTMLAVAAVVFVRAQAKLNELERFERFHKIMSQLASQDGTIAARLAALFELEHEQEYADLLDQALSKAYPPEEEAVKLQRRLRKKLDDRARRANGKPSG